MTGADLGQPIGAVVAGPEVKDLTDALPHPAGRSTRSVDTAALVVGEGVNRIRL